MSGRYSQVEIVPNLGYWVVGQEAKEYPWTLFRALSETFSAAYPQKEMSVAYPYYEFDGEYYEFDGELDKDDRELTPNLAEFHVHVDVTNLLNNVNAIKYVEAAVWVYQEVLFKEVFPDARSRRAEDTSTSPLREFYVLPEGFYSDKMDHFIQELVLLKDWNLKAMGGAQQKLTCVHAPSDHICDVIYREEKSTLEFRLFPAVDNQEEAAAYIAIAQAFVRKFGRADSTSFFADLNANIEQLEQSERRDDFDLKYIQKMLGFAECDNVECLINDILFPEENYEPWRPLFINYLRDTKIQKTLVYQQWKEQL